jgi:hypothetical protein
VECEIHELRATFHCEAMTRRQAYILKMMKGGSRLWRYSTQDSGYLIHNPSAPNSRVEIVRRFTIDQMIVASWIDIDFEKSTMRDSSGSDEVYKVVEHEKDSQPVKA